MRPLPGVLNVMDELRDGDPRQIGTGGTGQPFLGPSLATAVATYGPLPLASVLTLAAGLAETLSAAPRPASSTAISSPPTWCSRRMARG